MNHGYPNNKLQRTKAILLFTSVRVWEPIPTDSQTWVIAGATRALRPSSCAVYFSSLQSAQLGFLANHLLPGSLVWVDETWLDFSDALPESNLVLSGDLYATTLGLMCLCYKSGFRNPQIVCWFSGRRPSTTKCHFPWTLSHRPWLLCICLAWQNLMSWFKSSLGRLYLAWCHDQIWKRTGFNSLS